MLGSTFEHMPDEHFHSSLPRFLMPQAQTAAMRFAVVVLFTIAAGLSIWRVVHSLHDPAVSSKGPQGLIDFHHVVYLPAKAFAEGVNPYSRKYAAEYPVNRQYPLYSPGMLVVSSPFALLPLRVADVVYWTGSLALVIAFAASALAVCRVPLSVANILGLATLILISRPGHINLLLGQFTLPIALGALWALELARSRPWLAGVGLAAAALKPTFGVPLVWLMFCRRDFRAVAIGIAISTGLAVAGLAPLVMRDGLESVVQSVRESHALHEADPIVDPELTWTRVDALAFVAKVTPGRVSTWAEPAVSAICLLVAGFAMWRTSGSPQATGADNLSGLIIVSAALACVYHGTYDALLFVMPWVGAAFGALRRQLPAGMRPLVWLLLTVPAVSYFATESAVRFLSIEGPLWTALTAVNAFCVVATLCLAISAAFYPRQNGTS
jgi:hypothetical protein